MPDAPVEMIEREYEVIRPSGRPVLGHTLGDKFKATLHPVQEQQLLEGGQLKIVGGAKPSGAGKE